MKKLTTIMTGLFLLIASTAFTFPEADVSAKIKTVFEKEFITATEVKWERRQDIYLASFKEKDIYLTAAYSEDAELISIARYVTFTQLPLNVIRAVENKYAEYKIDPTVVELATGVTSYVIYAENGKFKLKIKSDSSGNLTVEDKTKKK